MAPCRCCIFPNRGPHMTIRLCGRCRCRALAQPLDRNFPKAFHLDLLRLEGESKISYLECRRLGQQTVTRSDVPMYVPHGVDVVQAFGRLKSPTILFLK
uniref:Uncharacterized protein n=1 Tax=Meloidogyne incognita TaxID=6306 RepID=A0A914MRG7_MELIC